MKGPYAGLAAVAADDASYPVTTRAHTVLAVVPMCCGCGATASGWPGAPDGKHTPNCPFEGKPIA